MPERDGPLVALILRLRSLGPPSLRALIGRLEEFEEYEGFVALVREFLPEREQEILGQPEPVSQIAAFASYFGDRYFPLQDEMMGMAEGYSDLTRGIPVVLLGLSDEDYHYMPEFRPGLRLMTYLLAAPEWVEEAARVAVGEACAEDVPIDLLRQVPEGGIPGDEIGRLVRGTPHEALAQWAGVLEWDTGNWFLDMTGEGLWEEMPDWDRETVEGLTQEWREGEQRHAAILQLAEWLEEDLPARFQELLDFLERRINDETQS